MYTFVPVTGTASATVVAAAGASFLTILSTIPSYATPLVASTVMSIPSLITSVAACERLLVPTIQGMPSSRPTIAA